MELQTTNYQCPNCQGRLSFNGELGKLQCEFCQSEFTVQEVEELFAAKQAAADAKASGDRAQDAAKQAGIAVESLSERQTAAMEAAYEKAVAEGKSYAETVTLMQQAAQNAATATAATVSAATASKTEATRVQAANIASTGDAVQDYVARTKWYDEEQMRGYNCPSCGAQIMVDQTTAVTKCPYCGNNTVVPGQLSDVLKPDYVIPFKLDKQAAIAALKRYYQGKRFLPNGFTEQNHLQEIQGVYVPFWMYSGTGTGDMTFNARNVRTWSDSKNMYTETDHYVLRREGDMQFERVPVDGSTKMPDAHMDAIEPYDYSELVPFSMAYLPGYLTERYDLDVDQCRSRAIERARVTCEATIEATASGYMEIDVANARSSVEWSNIVYTLLPVWMLHTKWNGQDFLFAMNGQTGKFIGDLPIDKGKVRKRFLSLFLPIAAVVAAGIYFFLGF